MFKVGDEVVAIHGSGVEAFSEGAIGVIEIIDLDEQLYLVQFHSGASLKLDRNEWWARDGKLSYTLRQLVKNGTL